MPELAQNRPSEGNRAVLVIVDTMRPSFKDVRHVALSALGHMGVPYKIWDAGRRQLPEQVVNEHALVFLAQDGVGASLNTQSAHAILAGLKNGVGLFSLDPWIMSYPEDFARILQLAGASRQAIKAIRFRTNRHYISALGDENEKVLFRKPATAVPLVGRGTALLAEDGAPFMRAGNLGAGRFVWFGIFPKVWFYEYLGHGWGLDDMFWRSIAWAAETVRHEGDAALCVNAF